MAYFEKLKELTRAYIEKLQDLTRVYNEKLQELTRGYDASYLMIYSIFGDVMSVKLPEGDKDFISQLTNAFGDFLCTSIYSICLVCFLEEFLHCCAFRVRLPYPKTCEGRS